MARLKTVYVCQQCAHQVPRWQGKCPECGAWNSLVEDVIEATSNSAKAATKKAVSQAEIQTQPLLNFADASAHEIARVSSGFSEADRVLGGGLVPGSLLLFGGEPGIGKSTLLLQIVAKIAARGTRCLYVSGEESGPQVASRAKRLGVTATDNLQFLATTSLDEMKAAVDQVKPKILVVDSVQTLQDQELDSMPGTVSQVRQVAQVCANIAKVEGITTLLVGHVTKEGSIAGPRLLEHMVDGVFYFELSANGGFRLLRGNKNRFGATHELAVFEMVSTGMLQVDNPSARFLAERAKEMPGSAIVAHMEGSRPFLTEVQALTQRCHQGFPRRTVQGVNQNRVSVLLAVLERTLDVSFAEHDVYCKVASGAQIEEPAADLPILFSLLSARLNKTLPGDVLFVGEVGLGGELRSVPGVSSRLSEGKSVGVRRAIIPAWSLRDAGEIKGLEVVAAKNIREVKDILGL